MAVVSQTLITAEEFSKLPNPPDGSQLELVRGVIVSVPPPRGRHGVCCSKVDRLIGDFVEAKGLGTVTANDTGIILERDPDTVRGPDVSFWRKERLPVVPEGYIDVPPDLAVEVASPGDHFARIQKRVLHFLACGVRLLWVVDPEDRSVTVYRPQKLPVILEESDMLSGEDVLAGFSCRVAELFG